MKYLYSMAAPLLVLAFTLFYSNSKTSVFDAEAYESFSDMVKGCDGEAIIGGACNASCASSCSCQTGLFKCECSCGPDSTTKADADADGHSSFDPATQSITTPPDANWEKILTIVASEDSEISKQLYQDIQRLRELGNAEKFVEYVVLSDELDERIMTLQPATIDKIVVAFTS